MGELQPSVSSGRKFSAVWIIPLVALVIGVWMVIYTYMTEGPTITIDFKTAEGLQADKTKVRLLNLEIGQVEHVVLREDSSGVRATVKLEPEARPRLREDTQFWVVRARVGAAGVSGLETLLAGAYIEMAPGSGAQGRREFVGLEVPPLTPLGAPGLRLVLFSDRAGSVSTGSAVLFQGYKVGRVEAMQFDTDRQQVRYDIFIDAPFHELVHSATRFWDISGVSINASASGIEVNMGSMETILLGGVGFDTPPNLPAGNTVEQGAEFKLYSTYKDILKNPYRHGTHYVVSFKQSLRGLVPGAPVEFRGIKVGRVERILLKETASRGLRGESDLPISVLIYLEPGRLEIPDSEASVALIRNNIEQDVRHGLRATLETGNLLTGSQLISLDYYPDEAPAEVGQFEQYATIPTIETGVGLLETQVSDLLKKLNALPLEQTVAGTNETLDQADAALVSMTTALDSINIILQSNGTKALSGELVTTLRVLRGVLDGFSENAEPYQNLNASLKSLDATLANLRSLTRQLSEKPNSMIFPTRPEKDPIPGASRQ